MSQLGNLLKKDLLNSFIMKIPYFWKTKKERKKLLLYPLLAVVFGAYIYFGITYFIDWIEGYDKLGMGDVYLGQSVFAYSMLLLMSIVTMTISNFYYSNDISILLPLPIKKSEILFSKILYNSLALFVTALFVVFPFMVRYGIYYNKSILFYLLFILGLFAHTVIMASIFTFLVVAMMSVINRFARAKNVMQLLGTILIIALSFGASYYFNSQVNQDQISLDFMGVIAQKMNGIIALVPTVKLLVSGVNGNVLNYVLLIAIALGLSYLVSQISGGLLTKGILNNQSVVKRRKLNVEEKAKAFKRDGVFSQLVKKDISDILKTPVYLTSTLLMGLVMPLAIAVPLIAQGADISSIMEKSNGLFVNTEKLLGMKDLLSYIIFALAIVMVFLSSSATNTAGTSITREGKYIWLMQTMPIEARTQITARVLSAMIIHFISLLPISIIVFVLLKPPYYFIIAYFVVLFSVGFFASSLGILMDTSRPKVDWQTPQQAMKSNFNAIVLTYATMIIAILIGVGGFFLIKNQVTGNRLMAASLMLIVLMLILGFVFYNLAIKTFKKKLATY